MENNIPGRSREVTPEVEGNPSDRSAVGLAVDRSLEARRAAALDEVERLVRAAFAVIARSGGLDPRVSDILSEAGLSNQAFYRHFRGKHELLVAVLDEGIRGLANYLAKRMSKAASPALAVREWIRGMAAQARDLTGAQATRPFALARGRLAESFPTEVARSQAQITAPLRAALSEARAAGEMPAVEPDRDAEILYHLMMGWIEARLVESRVPEAREVEALEAFALAGLGRSVRPSSENDTVDGADGSSRT